MGPPDQAAPDPLALRPHTSVILEDLVAGLQGGGATVGGLMEALRSRAYGLLVLIVALLSLVPGLSLVGGIVIILLAAQMTIGRGSPRLPGLIARHELPMGLVARTVRRLLPPLRFIERFVKPRYPLLTAPGARGIAGIVLIGLGIALLIPFPLSQIAPALAAVLSIGLLERDGAAFVAGLVLSVGALLVAVWTTLIAWRTFLGILGRQF